MFINISNRLEKNIEQHYEMLILHILFGDFSGGRIYS